MPRPIDANALSEIIEAKGKEYGVTVSNRCTFRDIVALTPTIDYAPVVHGEWEWDTLDVYMCSACGDKSHVKEVLGKPDWSYCPNCGSLMDGEGNER